MQAFADGAWGNWAMLQMTNSGDPAPVVSASPSAETVTPDSAPVLLASLFSASEADNDPITQYDVYEGSLGTPVGTISDGTSSLTPLQTYNFTSLTGLTYSAATVAGTDRLWVRALSGGQWSNWALVQMTNTGAVAPVTTASHTMETVGPDHGPVSLTSLFSTTEANSDAITQYNVYLGSLGTPVGPITDANGDLLSTLQDDTVTSLTGLTYHSSTTAGTDRLWVQACADGTWGNWALVQIVNTGPEAPVTSLLPVAQSQPLSVLSGGLTSGGTLQLAQLFSASDANGDQVTQYDVYEGSFATPVGTITDRLWVRAQADGEWGSWALVQVNDVVASGGEIVSVRPSLNPQITASLANTTQLQVSQLAQAMAYFAPSAPQRAQVRWRATGALKMCWGSTPITKPYQPRDTLHQREVPFRASTVIGMSEVGP